MSAALLPLEALNPLVALPHSGELPCLTTLEASWPLVAAGLLYLLAAA